MKEMAFAAIIFDEAQAIKNIVAGTTGAVRQLKGWFKLALTGTPVENHMGEYFSIMDLVLPGLLGEYREFQGKARHEMTTFLPAVRNEQAIRIAEDQRADTERASAENRE